MPRLTQSQIDEMIELREAGWSDGMLAIRYGVSKGSINWNCLMLGVSGNLATVRRIGPSVTYRNGKPVRRFTPEEDAKMLDLVAANHSRTAIARALGRNQRSVVARLATIARREELAA